METFTSRSAGSKLDFSTYFAKKGSRFRSPTARPAAAVSIAAGRTTD
jgi:hypothetical protein